MAVTQLRLDASDSVDSDDNSYIMSIANLGRETVTSGVCSIDVVTTELSVTGTQAYTLGDGRFVGAKKNLVCTVAASTPVGTLTINDAFGTEPTSYVFTAVGQRLELEWVTGGWKVVRLVTAGTDTPAAASTLRQMVQLHVIAISGTQDWVLPDGVVPGQLKTFKVASAASTPVGTISGLFYDEDGSADGVDINFDAAADMATVVWDGARWNPIQLVAATVS